MRKLRRFIAGAVCSNCKQADTTIVYTGDGMQIRECVICNAKDFLEIPVKKVSERKLVSVVDHDKAQPIKIVGLKNEL